MTLGEKIKQERKKRKLTQTALAGERITRNMISLIERDSANPSLETLKYISARLNLPLSYLISDSDDAFYYSKKEAMNGILAAYTAKNFATAILRVEKLEKTDDELAFILANSHMQLGKRAVFGGSLVTAENHFSKSLFYCDKTCYSTDHIRALVAMYSSVAKSIGSPLLEFNSEIYKNSVEELLNLEFYNYLTQNFDYRFSNPIFAKHLEAKKNMKDRDYKTALTMLTEADAAARTGEYNAYVIFGIYSDLETCYKQLGDFEKAYKYSSKRFSLLEGFKI